MEITPVVEPVKQTETSKLNDIYQFAARHKASFMIAAAWMIRELHTAHGLIGVWHFILTGSSQ